MYKISAIDYYLPEKIYTNEELEKDFPEWNSEKIEEKVGIKQRHIASDSETALDLAVKSCEKIFTTRDKNTIDFILFCTQSPDYFLPTTACILQDRLELRKNIGALDFNLGCSGFVYGLAIAKGLIASGIANTILLVTAETYSKHIHKEDKANRSIFGDAAASVIIERDENKNNFQFELGTDGSGYDNLIVKNGGFKSCLGTKSEIDDENKDFFSDDYLYMNGPEIFNFTIENIPHLINETLKKNHLEKEDINWFIFHQANKYMLNYLRKKAKIPEEKFYINMENTGNTVSATIPIALKNCLEEGKIQKGHKVLIAGFGVGYSWGATIIEF
ncbi:MAG: ketoacyl-ACP synthase III [Cloacibacterium sp.]|jgi:3-oxoacyl-[acyl-carrier-protein] synthase-3|nr:ketoacyl-ACP synthase III [Cloacibacterium sp.]